MADKDDAPESTGKFDLRFEIEDGEFGVKQLTITALQMQGEIDLEMELPRIRKLLTRDWEAPDG